MHSSGAARSQATKQTQREVLTRRVFCGAVRLEELLTCQVHSRTMSVLLGRSHATEELERPPGTKQRGDIWSLRQIYHARGSVHRDGAYVSGRLHAAGASCALGQALAPQLRAERLIFLFADDAWLRTLWRYERLLAALPSFALSRRAEVLERLQVA